MRKSCTSTNFGLGFVLNSLKRVIYTPIVENQMEKKMEDEMENANYILGYIRII